MRVTPQDGPKIVCRERRKRAKMLQDGNTKAQDGPKTEQMAATWTKTSTTCPQMGHGGTWVAQGMPIGTNVEAQEAPTEALFGPAWGGSGDDLGLIWG